jgi:hypothetical protein
MPGVIEFNGNRAHDGDHDALLYLWVNSLYSVCTQHS